MNVFKKDINNIFFIFISFHLIVWTLAPSITNNNLPLDTIEALAWSSNLDWGFNKHPPGSAFFPEIFCKLLSSNITILVSDGLLNHASLNFKIPNDNLNPEQLHFLQTGAYSLFAISLNSSVQSPPCFEEFNNKNQNNIPSVKHH